MRMTGLVYVLSCRDRVLAEEERTDMTEVPDLKCKDCVFEGKNAQSLRMHRMKKHAVEKQVEESVEPILAPPGMASEALASARLDGETQVVSPDVVIGTITVPLGGIHAPPIELPTAPSDSSDVGPPPTAPGDWASDYPESDPSAAVAPDPTLAESDGVVAEAVAVEPPLDPGKELKQGISAGIAGLLRLLDEVSGVLPLMGGRAANARAHLITAQKHWDRGYLK